MIDTPQAPPKTTSEAMAKPLPFEPQDFSQMWALVNWVKDSALVPSALRGKPADLLIVFATGRELGLSAMQAMRSLHVVDGKPGMAADLIAARIRRSGVCRFLRLIKSDNTEAIYESQRTDDDVPTQIQFTIAEAEKLGLAGKDNYKKQAATMLRARCISKMARVMYQDVLFGVYEISELDDVREHAPASDVTVLPVDATPRKASRSLAGLISQPTAAAPMPAPQVIAASAGTAGNGPLLTQQDAAREEPAPKPRVAKAAPDQARITELVRQLDGLATKVGRDVMVRLCEQAGGSLGAKQYGLTSAVDLETLLGMCEGALERAQ